MMGMVFQRKLLSKYYGQKIDYWDGSTINKPGPFVFLLTLESHRQITKLATGPKPYLFKEHALLYEHFGTGHAPVTSLVSFKIKSILKSLIIKVSNHGYPTIPVRFRDALPHNSRGYRRAVGSHTQFRGCERVSVVSDIV